MKKILSATIFLCFVKMAFAQTHPIVGAWIGSDSDKQVSMFIKHDGEISIHSAKKQDVIITKNLKKGKYSYKKNVLVITWSDNTVEKCKVDFIDRDNVVIKNRK